jgi:hypothetical protein
MAFLCNLSLEGDQVLVPYHNIFTDHLGWPSSVTSHLKGARYWYLIITYLQNTFDTFMFVVWHSVFVSGFCWQYFCVMHMLLTVVFSNSVEKWIVVSLRSILFVVLGYSLLQC